MNKEILDKVDEIIDYIQSSSDYQKYLMIEKQMNNNIDIIDLIEAIKRLQKKAVYEDHIGNNNKVKQLDEEINNKLEKLNNIPLYIEYNNIVEILNNTLFNIKNNVESYINEKTN